jgi:hypothetical protein
MAVVKHLVSSLLPLVLDDKNSLHMGPLACRCSGIYAVNRNTLWKEIELIHARGWGNRLS